VSCFGYKTVSSISQGGVESGIHSKKKPTITNRIPVTATFGRANEAAHCSVLTKCCDKRAQLNVSLEGNEKQGISC
jgi:hypothetical protein